MMYSWGNLVVLTKPINERQVMKGFITLTDVGNNSSILISVTSISSVFEQGNNCYVVLKERVDDKRNNLNFVAKESYLSVISMINNAEGN